MVYEIYDPDGKTVIKRFKHDMAYVGGFMTHDDATSISSQFKERGYKTFIFSPTTSRGAMGYPFNLWASRFPVRPRRTRTK
jgi:hypothetical protein